MDRINLALLRNGIFDLLIFAVLDAADSVGRLVLRLVTRGCRLVLVRLRCPSVLLEWRLGLLVVLVVPRRSRRLSSGVVSTRHLLEVKSGQSLRLLRITPIISIAPCPDLR